jgi:ribulose-5-phosphate 4-epimerase/fuculose-1-phosphate aldolase
VRDGLLLLRERIVDQGLAERPADVRLYALDDHLYEAGDPPLPRDRAILSACGAASLLVLVPSAPYREALSLLGEGMPRILCPRDSETTLFLHDIPVVPGGEARHAAGSLRRRKACVLLPSAPGAPPEVAAAGSFVPAQAHLAASAVCFAAFVLLLHDLLREGAGVGDGRPLPIRRALAAVRSYPSPRLADPLPPAGPYRTTEEALAAMDACGKLTVSSRLVDSYFGNLSCSDGKTLLVSRTASALDDLPGNVDPVPLDGSSTAALTASSETGCHAAVVRSTPHRAILHGHPPFSVALSMLCREEACCPEKGACAIRCPAERFVAGTPVVPGETGMGPFGLARTVPKALKEHDAVIVWGHGVFAGGADFREAYERLRAVEAAARDRVEEILAPLDRD